MTEKETNALEEVANAVAAVEEATPQPEAQKEEEPKKRTPKSKKKDGAEVVQEVQAPPVEPEDKRPFALIGGKKYYIDSDNKELLRDVAGGKAKDEKGNWVEQTFKYLPAEHIYTLLDGLFTAYNFKSLPAKFLEEYNTKKRVWDYKNKKWVEEDQTVRVYEKQVSIETTIVLDEYNSIIRETYGYAQGVATLGILTNDNARNGFMNKLAMRARKEALKNLGKVFRTYEGEDEDTFTPEETVEVAGKSTGSALSEVADATSKVAEKVSETDSAYQAIKEKLLAVCDFWAGGFEQQVLLDAMRAVKADLKIAPDTPEMIQFKKIYDELKGLSKSK